MKKSSIIILAGCFVLVTALLCISDKKMYEKQKHFNTVDEVLEQMQNYPIQAKSEKGKIIETNEFKECLSKRKRLTYSQFDFSNIKITKIHEMSEEEKKKIIDHYTELKQNLSRTPKYDNIQVERVSAKIGYNYVNDDLEEAVIDFVFIDEGEGFVIDYIVKSYYKNQGNSNVEY